MATNVVEISAILSMSTKDVEKDVEQLSYTFDNTLGNAIRNLFDVDLYEGLAQLQLEMTAVFSDVGGTVDDVFDSITRSSADSVHSMTKLSEAALAFQRAGIGTAETVGDLAKAANDLSMITGTDLAQSTDSIIKVMNTFGMSADDTDKIVTMLAYTANNAAFTLQDLDYSLRYVSATASAAGVDIEEVNAMLMVMADNGIKGSQAGTRLKNMMVEMQKEAKGLKKAGIDVYDEFGEMNDITDIIEQMKDATKDMTKEQRNLFLGEFFNTRAMDAVNVLMENIENVTDNMEDLKKVTGDGSWLGDVMAEIGEADYYKFLEFKNAVEDFKILLVQSVMPALVNLLKPITDFVNKFKELPKAEQKVIAGLLAILPLIGMMVMVSKVLVGLYGNLVLLFTVAIPKAISKILLLKKVWTLIQLKLVLLGKIWAITMIKVTVIVLLIVAAVWLLMKYWKQIVSILKVVGRILLTIGIIMVNVLLAPFRMIIDIINDIIKFINKFKKTKISLIPEIPKLDWKMAWSSKGDDKSKDAGDSVEAQGFSLMGDGNVATASAFSVVAPDNSDNDAVNLTINMDGRTIARKLGVHLSNDLTINGNVR